MGALITLTTDFGLTDAYAAIMKGVILRINPEVTIVDICHTIQPQNIRQAAFVLGTAYNYFPSQTIHLVVVDPGVGTNRRPIILKTPRMYFVAPDNGVLSYIIDAFNSKPKPDRQQVSLVSDLKAYAITNSDYWLKPVSQTFHGRDIFAPVAARLSLGMPAFSLGENIDTITAFPIPRPYSREKVIIGQVMHIDTFGNLITNFKQDGLPAEGQSITIVVGNKRVHGLARVYAEGEGLIALVGSSGYLEISLKNGNASLVLQSHVGDEVRIE